MLRIFNTLTRQKEEFRPLVDKQATFYHCGPTVYWTQHIGNMRAAVMADLVRRTLEYLGDTVKMARNYTDVGHLTGDNEGDADTGQDRMEKAAKRESLDPETIADKYIAEFDRDISLLNVQTPEFRPRATQLLAEDIKLIQTLFAKGYAYTTALGIYFDVSKFKNYGELSGQKPEDKEAGKGKGRVSDQGKKNPADFFIWLFKAGEHENALQTWPSPFVSPLVKNGQGFPGWHLECSVMAKKFLGNTIDLHMGGVEHIPIHHTNEIAQSEAANGVKFVNYWLHNEWLMINDGKVSKSAGASIVLQDIIDKGYNPLALRYFFLNAHYRSKQNFTWQALDAARITLEKLYDRMLAFDQTEPGAGAQEFELRFQTALEDDFNTPQALAVMWDMFKSNAPASDQKASLLKFDQVLGLRLADLKKEHIKIPQQVRSLIEQRDEARKNKDFKKADQIREQIESAGFTIEDSPSGVKINKS